MFSIFFRELLQSALRTPIETELWHRLNKYSRLICLTISVNKFVSKMLSTWICASEIQITGIKRFFKLDNWILLDNNSNFRFNSTTKLWLFDEFFFKSFQLLLLFDEWQRLANMQKRLLPANTLKLLPLELIPDYLLEYPSSLSVLVFFALAMFLSSWLFCTSVLRHWKKTQTNVLKFGRSYTCLQART